jgi:hypothetical protein
VIPNDPVPYRWLRQTPPERRPSLAVRRPVRRKSVRCSPMPSLRVEATPQRTVQRRAGKPGVDNAWTDTRVDHYRVPRRAILTKRPDTFTQTVTSLNFKPLAVGRRTIRSQQPSKERPGGTPLGDSGPAYVREIPHSFSGHSGT